jgi:hypothetical protein
VWQASLHFSNSNHIGTQSSNQFITLIIFSRIWVILELGNTLRSLFHHSIELGSRQKNSTRFTLDLLIEKRLLRLTYSLLISLSLFIFWIKCFLKTLLIIKKCITFHTTKGEPHNNVHKPKNTKVWRPTGNQS